MARVAQSFGGTWVQVITCGAHCCVPQGLLFSAAEGFLVATFVYVIAPKAASIAEVVVLPSLVILFPVFLTLVNSFRKRLSSRDSVPSSVPSTAEERQPLNEEDQSGDQSTKICTPTKEVSTFTVLSFIIGLPIVCLLFLGRLKWWVIAAIFSVIWSPSLQTWTLGERENHGNDSEERRQSPRWMTGIINGLSKLVIVIVSAVALRTNLHNRPISALSFISSELQYVAPFVVAVGSSLGAYLLSWLSLRLQMQFFGFYFPLLASSAASLGFLITCNFKDDTFNAIDEKYCAKISATDFAGLVLLQLFELLVILIYANERLKTYALIREEKLFIQPWYTGPFVGETLLLNLKTKMNFSDHKESEKEKVTVIIASTMYKESQDEQKTLFKSIQRIYEKQKRLPKENTDYQFQWHIWFDNATRKKGSNDCINSYVKTLLEIFKEKNATLKSKHVLPYGLQIKVELGGGSGGNSNFPVVIHLKDTTKWKQKKRWSQVMYMQYVLNFFCNSGLNKLDKTYVLTTDGDVQFEPEDVEILLDRLNMDERVGGVSGRVYPEGSGLVVWYQQFEYAAGYWLQKVAEHVFGTVMCSPGCFSAFRAKALREVLPEYSKNVDEASDFLKMDMGEDRWLSTLLIRKGWKLDYAASSKCITKCPESFDDFYTQRRRWIPSTLANIFHLGSVSWPTLKSNESFTFFFLIYMMIFIFSTMIGPATILLVMAAGLEYSLLSTEDNRYVVLIASLTVFAFICLFYVWVCFYCCRDTQLLVGKVLTFLFASVMGAVLIGVILQVIHGLQFNGVTPTDHPFIIIPPGGGSPNVSSVRESISLLGNSSSKIGDKLSSVAIPIWYVGGMISIFVVAALLHISDSFVLFKGLLYLFCLPSGYILLTVFALCNLTSQSWGTREKSKQSENDGKTLNVRFLEGLAVLRKYCCFCFQDINNVRRIDAENVGVQTVTIENRETGIQVEEQVGNEDEYKELQLVRNIGVQTATIEEGETGTQVEEAMEQVGNEDEYKEILTDISTEELEDEELTFWNELPESVDVKVNNAQMTQTATEEASSKAQAKLKENLKKLRSYWLWLFTAANTLWTVLMVVVEVHPGLAVRSSNALGSTFLLVYGITFTLQFFACVWNRFETLIHYLSRRNPQESLFDRCRCGCNQN